MSRSIASWKDRKVAKPPNRYRDRNLRSRYGITLAEYEEMVEEQGGRCALCGKRQKLCVDHDHSSGEVRGLLCKICNSRLGWWETNKELIEVYLEV